MENLHQLYDNYQTQAKEVRDKAPAFAGIFGFGNDPRKHPCHEQFYADVETWVGEFLQTEPGPRQAMEAATFLTERPKKCTNEDSYWFMYACIGFVRSLVPLMAKEDCKALAEKMNALYPRRERMPVQQETMKLLQKAGK